MMSLIGGAQAGAERVPADVQRSVSSTMIDEAISALLKGAEHGFHGSRDYDVLVPTGERLPPKAVFGIALSKVLGREATPKDFSAGWAQPCFDVIEAAGYPIVPKDEVVPGEAVADADDERSWAEGSLKRVQHLRRERAPGLARMKKRRFIEQHGKLHCERCLVVPSSALGEHGDACIEVHHMTTAVAKMDSSSRTRLADLQCLCANCHRIVHREQLTG
jgi:5-methylcytosine-specific restriction protein A